MGLTWVMTNVLPAEAGLTVDGVIYRYTTIKQTQDEMYVNIQNENALGEGYIFKETDNWSGLPGNTITKRVPVGNIPREYWGNGEISVEGRGQVTNPNVAYTYRYDTCYNPINDPSCPGYDAAMAEFLTAQGLLNQKTEIEDPLSDENVKSAMDNKTEVKEEENDKEDKEDKESKEKKDKERLKIATKAAEETVGNALAISQTAMIEAMADVPRFESYYTTIQGGMYEDVAQYKPTQIPENKRGLRVGLAQQLLHNQMVDGQYRKQR